jgi:CRP/FNR family transcriptional regulator, dissimilatory nitrate respiration regulator
MDLVEDHAAQFIRSLPFFSGLPQDDADAFVKAAHSKDYKKYEALFHLGDSADRFFVVLSGWIKLYRETGEGEEAVVALFKRGDVFGEAAIFNGAGYPFSAEASEDSKVLEISAAVLRERARVNHDIMDRVMASMSKELRNLRLENEHLALMSAPQRVGCLLLQLSAGRIGKGGTFSFPYDKSLAAARLGILAQLKPVGVTVHGPEVKIESFSCLIDYCCGHCSSLPGECPGSRACADKKDCPGKKTACCG